MNILCIGDIVGKPGREALEGLLESIKKEHNIDFAIVNAENTAGGAGITTRLAKQLFDIGCDVLTLGDHVWDQKDLEPYLDEEEFIIRPANFPEGVPGKGWCIKTAANGSKVAVINLLGRTFMRYAVSCPFKAMDDILKEIQKETSIIVLDMHAEATSEKVALGHYLNGRISLQYGTHTHIQTADETILSEGTAYITDLGMSGPYDSVIGQNKDNIINRFLTSRPIRFKVASENVKLCGCIVEVDQKTGKATAIKRLQVPFDCSEKK
jgi:metallophosphoesterase (TIGR00282 family)